MRVAFQKILHLIKEQGVNGKTTEMVQLYLDNMEREESYTKADLRKILKINEKQYMQCELEIMIALKNIVNSEDFIDMITGDKEIKIPLD